MNVDVLILFEHKNRELESAVLLKQRLETQGISVAIRQHGWNANIALTTIHPKLIVTPWFYDDRDIQNLYHSSAPDNKLKIVNLHCEQLANPTAMDFLLPSSLARDSVHLCWGSFFAECLKKKGISEDLIYITGSPRLDFFRDELRYISQTKQDLSNQFHLDVSKKWILVIGNYSGAFASEKTLEDLSKRGYTNIYENRDMAVRAYQSMLSWLESALKAIDSGVEFIYRPHPSEAITPEILALQSKYPHLHVIKELAIRDWMLNSDLGAMWLSTSCVEAAYSELPVVSLRPFPIPEHSQLPLLEKATQIDNADDFISYIKSATRQDASTINMHLNKALDHYYHKNERLAVDLTADCILDVLTNESIPSFESQSGHFILKFRKILHYWGKRLLYKLGILQKMPNYKTLASDYISSAEIKHMEERMKNDEN